MHSKNKQKIRRAFDKASTRYDKYADFQTEVANELARIIINDGQTGDIALDIGCGTGVVSTALAKSGLYKKVIAADISEGMLKLATGKSNHPTDPRPLLTDAEALPIMSGSVDLVVSSMALQWVEDLQTTLQDIGRILKPNGKFVCTTLGQGTFDELKQTLTSIWPNDDRLRLSGVFHEFVSLDRLDGVMNSCGMTGNVVSVPHQRNYPSFFSFLKTLKKVGAQNSHGFSSLGLGRRELMRLMEKEYQKRFSTNDGVMATYQVIHIEAKRLSSK